MGVADEGRLLAFSRRQLCWEDSWGPPGTVTSLIGPRAWWGGCVPTRSRRGRERAHTAAAIIQVGRGAEPHAACGAV